MTRTTLAVVGAIVAAVLICVGGWFLYWHLRQSATQRTGEILQDTYGRQNALVEQILDDYRDVNDPTLPPAQVRAITTQLCDSAAKLNGTITLPLDVAAYITKECS